MNKIELSIVIVNLNSAELTLGCLRSIEKWAGDLSFEVILIDNGSTDESVNGFQKIINEKYWKNRLTIILNTTNLGYSKANNQGIKKAKGKYVLLLNNDTVIHQDSLQNLLKFGRNNPDAGVIGSRLLNIDGSLQKSCFHFPTIVNAFKESWFNHKGLLDSYAPLTNKPVTVASLAGAVFLISPKALNKVGMLDERYFAYFEDMDYCKRVWNSGLKVYYLPDSVITHYHGSTFKKLTEYENQWRKLIPGSKIYNGVVKHYIIFLIMWTGQKWQKYFG